MTNHPLHPRARPSDVPDDIDGSPATNNSYARARSLCTALAGAPLGSAELWNALEVVRAGGGNDDPDAQPPPVGTLWHSQYDIEARSVDFEFYLGDNTDGLPRRSTRRSFVLAR